MLKQICEELGVYYSEEGIELDLTDEMWSKIKEVKDDARRNEI